MTPSPYISVLIVSWNALKTIQRCLPSVAQTKYDSFEILFVDNASEDGSVQWVEDHFPEIGIVRHPENWAFCRGNNEAVHHARGEIVILLNNDVEVPQDWLGPIAEAFKSDPNIGAAQPKLHQFDNREYFEYAGAAGGFLDRDGYPFTRGRIFDTMEQDLGQYDGATELFWASGTCLAVRRKLFEKLGGLEESFFMHMEEIDLCWRIKSAGYRIVLVPETVVFHIGGASLSHQSSQKHFLNFRNNLLMLYRNLPPSEWRKVLVRRFFLDMAAVVRMLLSFEFGHGFAIIRAYWAAHRMKNLQKKVRPVKGQYVAPLPYRGSIVLDYFLRKRRHFSELPTDLFQLTPPVKPDRGREKSS